MMSRDGSKAVGGDRSFWRCAVLLAGVLLGVGQGSAGAQAASLSQTQSQAAVSGVVVNRAGQPVSRAVVRLEARDGAKPVEALTDERGHFATVAVPVGTYAVRAEKAGVRSGAVSVAVLGGAAPEVHIVLEVAGGVPASAAAASSISGSGIEFSDKPNFTIAGVTDWTAVGGHGSDATLRTSEDLTRETLRLRAQGAGQSAEQGASGTTAHDEAGREAEVRLRKDADAAPRSYAANHALGVYYLHAARFEQALPPLQMASDLDHAKADDEYDLALACQGLGDFARAREHLQHALAQSDAAEYHRLEGALDERLGDSLAAVRQEERATEMDPSEQNFFTWGSELLLHRAIWQAAEVLANGAKAHPTSARLKTAWGTALFAGARYDEAAQRMCEASDLAPEDAEPYLFMGKIALAAPTPLPCVQSRLERFVRLQPHRADAAYFYAMSLLKQGDAKDRVAALLTRAVDVDPKYAPAYLQLGILAFAQRNYPAAIGYYGKAIAADPQDGEAHYRLGVAYDRTGEADKARAEFQTHDTLERAQADAVEQQRRQVKQFLIVLQGKPAEIAQP